MKDPDDVVSTYTKNSPSVGTTYIQQITYNKLGTWQFLNASCADVLGNVAINTSVGINTTVTEDSQPATGGGGGGGGSVFCSEDKDCESFGLDFYCVNFQCIKLNREDIAYQNLLSYDIPEDLANQIARENDGICNYDGVCDLIAGENQNNCGGRLVTVDGEDKVIPPDCGVFDVPIPGGLLFWATIILIGISAYIIYERNKR